MHKSSRRRVIAIVMLASFAMLAFVPRAALAESFYSPFRKDASTVKNGETITIYRHLSVASDWSASFRIIDGKKKLANVHCSNKKVARAQLENPGSLLITAAQKGKSKLSFKYRGKTRTVNVVVKDYVNAFKTLKLGKTNITKELNSEYNTSVEGKLARGKKLTVRPKSGWKVLKIQAVENVQAAMNGAGHKSIKPGGTIPKKAKFLIINMRNAKDKGCIQYQVALH